jgi:hypothetical protein
LILRKFILLPQSFMDGSGGTHEPPEHFLITQHMKKNHEDLDGKFRNRQEVYT